MLSDQERYVPYMSGRELPLGPFLVFIGTLGVCHTHVDYDSQISEHWVPLHIGDRDLWSVLRVPQLMDQITIETDLFEHREVKPHFINPCCFGEDFATWLKQELSRFAELGVELSEPIQEDYGWGLWASRDKDQFWIALSYAGDGPQEAPAQWVVSITYDPGLNLAKRLFHKPDRQVLEQLQNRVRQILASNSAITMING
jgi:hypothetical protein